MPAQAEIRYLSHKVLQDPRIKQVLPMSLLHEFDDLATWRKITVVGSAYVRYGHNNLPFRNDHLLAHFGNTVDLDSIVETSFSDALDQSVELYRQSRWDRPWRICWSGGIDSTCMVTSILRNLPNADLGNIKIAMDLNSYQENPRFFHQYIEPNFELIHTDEVEHHSSAYWTWASGHADMLFPDSVRLFDHAMRGLGDLDFHKNPTKLIELLDQYCGPGAGSYLHSKIIGNLQNVALPIRTYDHFFWWICFNHGWHSDLMNFENKFLGWFDSQALQKWSIYHVLCQEKQSYKHSSKRYIYEFNNDYYYYVYKTKMNSSGVVKTLSGVGVDPNPPVAILTDGTILKLNNMDRLLDLLPSHVNH